MKVYSVDEIRFVEEKEDEIGTRFIRLMENAGSASAKRIEKYMDSSAMICVVCGRGKNGGDGFVIARKLYEKGYSVSVVLAGGIPTANDAIEMYRKLDSFNINIYRFDREQTACEKAIASANLLVDCVFGIGFHGEAESPYSEVFEWMNFASAPIIAIDVPSGVNSDTGEVCESAVYANLTLAITTLKPAHILLPARELCGDVEVLNIGISDEALESVSPRLETLDFDEVKYLIPARPIDCHKNDFGHVLCICGSRNMPGAACLSSGAASVAGAGLTTVAFPESAYASLASGMKEIMLLPLPDIDGKLAATVECISALHSHMKKANAIVIGPGLGQGPDVTEVVFDVIRNATCPVVIDADAINAISSDLSILKEARSEIIITPHPGEMSRLTGLTVSEIEGGREGLAAEFAKAHNITVLLKGAATVVASHLTDKIYINWTGTPALAKGGSGDVLSGIIAAMIANGHKPYEAAKLGAYLHGYAASQAAKETGIASMVASDIFDGIRETYKALEK